MSKSVTTSSDDGLHLAGSRTPNSGHHSGQRLPVHPLPYYLPPTIQEESSTSRHSLDCTADDEVASILERGDSMSSMGGRPPLAPTPPQASAAAGSALEEENERLRLQIRALQAELDRMRPSAGPTKSVNKGIGSMLKSAAAATRARVAGNVDVSGEQYESMLGSATKKNNGDEEGVDEESYNLMATPERQDSSPIPPADPETSAGGAATSANLHHRQHVSTSSSSEASPTNRSGPRRKLRKLKGSDDGLNPNGPLPHTDSDADFTDYQDSEDDDALQGLRKKGQSSGSNDTDDEDVFRDDVGVLLASKKKAKIESLQIEEGGRNRRATNDDFDDMDMEVGTDPDGAFGDVLRDRAVWLVGLMVLQSLSSFIIARNEALLRTYPVITQFLTMLVGAGGNAGNQASVRVIRGLAVGSLHGGTIRRFLTSEAMMALCLSAILGVAGYIRAAVFQVPLPEAVAITSTLYLIVNTSILIGSLLPLGLNAISIDPAHSATSIQVIMDITGVLCTVMVSSFVLNEVFKTEHSAGDVGEGCD